MRLRGRLATLAMLAAGRTIGWHSRLAAIGLKTRRAYLQIFGIPDYERYLSHRAAHHPGEAPMSRRDFCAQAIERKYGGSGPKCC
jgi:uncharacterized short protein YbdD (DUF466 family)